MPDPLCILGVREATLEHWPTETASVRELFEFQRRLARSHSLNERLATLFAGARLGERLARCSDQEIADLLSLVQDGMGIFTPEFAVCEHAKQRLQQPSAMARKENWQMGRDAGVELLNAEAALFRAGIPHLLLPFQQNRFASNVFFVPQVFEARAWLLRAGFRYAPSNRTVLMDSQTNRPIRLVEAEQEK
jgi:hypothetical protein